MENRQFVLAVHDYFLEQKLQSKQNLNHDKVSNPETLPESNAVQDAPAVDAHTSADDGTDSGYQDVSQGDPQGHAEDGVAHSRALHDWAVNLFNVARLEPIGEAFDEDTSGMITISEVNKMTNSCPKGWRCDVAFQRMSIIAELNDFSLPLWLAYWAIGIILTVSCYFARTLNVILQDGVWRLHITLTRSIQF